MKSRSPVEVIGVYRVAVSNELFERTFAARFGEDRLEDVGNEELLQLLGVDALQRYARRYLTAELASIHLIEVVVHRPGQAFDILAFRQVDPCFPESLRQVPHQSTVLSSDGAELLNDLPAALALSPELLERKLRFAFFIHFLDPERPLETPFGRVPLPQVTELPDRLKALQYKPIDPPPW